MTEYTLEDLRRAEEALREGDSGRHNNPGRTRRNHLAAMARVSEIRAALIKSGVLTPQDRKTPA